MLYNYNSHLITFFSVHFYNSFISTSCESRREGADELQTCKWGLFVLFYFLLISFYKKTTILPPFQYSMWSKEGKDWRTLDMHVSSFFHIFVFSLLDVLHILTYLYTYTYYLMFSCASPGSKWSSCRAEGYKPRRYEYVYIYIYVCICIYVCVNKFCFLLLYIYSTLLYFHDPFISSQYKATR